MSRFSEFENRCVFFLFVSIDRRIMDLSRKRLVAEFACLDMRRPNRFTGSGEVAISARIVIGVFVAALVGFVESSSAATETRLPYGQEETDQNDIDQVDNGGSVVDQDSADPPQPAKKLRDGFLIQVPLPINQDVDLQVRRMIERVLERLPPAATSSERPILLLEFDTSNGASGEGSQLERCLSLARYLTSADLNKVRTVAYIPEHRGIRNPDDDAPKSRLVGHAVLVAVACEELIMHDDAVIGAAGIDEEKADALLLAAYQSIADRRLVLPPPLVLSFLDRDRQLYKISTNEGVVLEDKAGFEALESEGRVVGFDIVSERGSLAEFTSDEMLDMQQIRHRVSSRLELARRLDVKEEALMGDPSLGEEWRPIMLRFEGQIQQQDVNWAVTALQRAIDVDNRNLVLVEIDSTGGSLEDALRIAQRLAGLDPTKVRTVAYVPKRARGGAAMIALACDHLVMHPEASVGGPSEPELTSEQVAELRATLEDLANSRSRDWSVFAALLDPNLTLNRYQNKRTGRSRILIPEQHKEIEEPDQWAEMGEVDSINGLTGANAERLLLARYLASNFSEVKSFYQLSEDPELLEPTLAHRWIEDLGRQLASPWIAGWLLFGAMFFLSTELSQPGTGVPGFLSAICFVLFFWSQYCDGNVQWFEVLLLVVGAIFVLIEIFALPGFGVFGVGGILMIIASLFLAMQSFVIPTSSSDMRELPASIAVVIAGFSGMFVAMAVIRRFLPHVPVLNRMILTPPEPIKSSESYTGTTGSFDELLDQPGTTVTPLSPAGKVRVGKQLIDVVTDGRFIEKDQRVVVHEVRGNHVMVMPADLSQMDG